MRDRLHTCHLSQSPVRVDKETAIIHHLSEETLLYAVVLGISEYQEIQFLAPSELLRKLRANIVMLSVSERVHVKCLFWSQRIPYRIRGFRIPE